MKYDKVTIVGVIACVLFFFAWLHISSRFAPPPPRRAAIPEQEEPTSADAPTDGGAQQHTPVTVDEKTPAPAAKTPPQTPAEDTTPTQDAGTAGPAEEAPPRAKPEHVARTLTSEDTFTAYVGPEGEGIRHVDLKQYFQDQDEDGEEDDDARRLPVRLGHYDYPLLALKSPAGSWKLGPPVIAESSPRKLVLERMVNDGSIELREVWTVGDKPYEIGYTIELKNAADSPVTIPALVVEGGALPPSTSPDRRVSARGGVGAGGVTVAMPQGGRPKTFSMKSLKKLDAQQRHALAGGPVSWVAVHSKYFLFCILPEEGTLAGCSLAARPPPEAAAEDDSRLSASERYQADVLLAPASLNAGEVKRVSLRAYAGPKKYELLHAMGNRVVSVMEMDRFLMFNPAWMGLLSRGILAALIWLNGLFDGKWGYGFAIIILTVAVKLVFWPLSHRSTQSMRRMQKLQPQLKELREKYKDEPQKMYRKQQELFKENNVSQFGSCLPILFQIPVFFALFNTFRNAIELRQAGFLWATDLSLPDTLGVSLGGLPIRPLAILMGLTMIGQQKLMPSGDPNQARMMTFMSLFFIVLFYSMPSALTLYMTVNQVLTVAQTLVTRHLEKGAE